ncbi:hypothetical protein ABZZ74_51470 [Streptomyces sp. NPDC006476]|uniref:effector-associated constant component EACC1 n=1 Tax=Streptomyces sp. NPDC006476 TaxID=3157175 RepID=UPI00339EEAF6
MQFRLSIQDSEDEAAVAWLYRWLTRDGALASDVDLSLVDAELGSEAQGGAFEAINAVVTDGIALGNLLVAVRVAMDARRREADRAALRIEGRGVVVTVARDSSLSNQEIIDLLRGNVGAEENGEPAADS